MSINTKSLIQESLGNKLFCTKKQLISLCLNAGLCGSISGAETALKLLPWIKMSPKRMVVSRNAVLEYFQNHILNNAQLEKRNMPIRS